MFRKILIPVDNSAYSNRCIDIGISLAQKFGAGLVGSHVYAARMHEVRFKQMENDLPERYRQEEQLDRQKRVHTLYPGTPQNAVIFADDIVILIRLN